MPLHPIQRRQIHRILPLTLVLAQKKLSHATLSEASCPAQGTVSSVIASLGLDAVRDQEVGEC